MTTITRNGFTAKVTMINGKECLSLADLCHLSHHHFTKIYKMYKNKKFKLLDEVCDNDSRGTYLTVNGCVKFLNMFKTPDDGLIWQIEKELCDPILTDPTPQYAKQPAEIFVENETRLSDFLCRIHVLETAVDNIKDRLEEVSIQQKCEQGSCKEETSFKALIKECLKEIIKEELQ